MERSVGRNEPCPCGSGKKYKKCCHPDTESKKLKSFDIDLLPIFLISFLGIIVYSNTFHCSFHLDDEPFIINNSLIRNIQNVQGIWSFWPTRFLSYISLAFNYHIDQLTVIGYHLFNLAVHLLTAISVWWLTLLTLSTPAIKENKITRHANLIALFIGLLFVSHPLQTEAVTYIVQRSASMATLFYVATICFYAKSRLLQDSKSISGLWKFYYIGSLVTAVMAMFTKETAITLPLMILLYEFSFLKTKRSMPWGYLTPFLLTLFIIPLVILITKTEAVQEAHDVLEGPGRMSTMHYLLTQFRVMVTYIRLLFLPLNQNLDYDFPIAKSIFELPIFFGLLFLCAVLFTAKRLFSQYRLVSFSIFWFFLTLLPESSFLPSQDVIFEHRLYLPMVGFSMFLVSSVYYLLGKHTIKTMAIVLMMIVACNSVLTYQRNKVWKDEFSLWMDIARKSPYKARPYNNLGVIYDEQGDSSEAMSDYNKAIEVDPKFTEAYINRGIFYEKHGNLTQALSDYDKAVELNPYLAAAYLNRGNAYAKQNNFTQALSDYNKTIEINPNFVGVYYNRGILYDKQGNFTQAISDFTKTIEIDPNDAKAYLNCGLVYFKQNNLIQAMVKYNKAIELDPNFAEAFNNRAIVYYVLKEYDKAWDNVHKAEELGYTVNPGFISALKAEKSSLKAWTTPHAKEIDKKCCICGKGKGRSKWYTLTDFSGQC